MVFIEKEKTSLISLWSANKHTTNGIWVSPRNTLPLLPTTNTSIRLLGKLDKKNSIIRVKFIGSK